MSFSYWASGGVEQSACVTYIVQGASSGMSWHLTPLERTAWEKYFGLLCKSECWECGTGQTGALLLDTHPPSSHGVSWIKKNVRGHQWLFCLTWCLRRDVTWPGPYKIIAHREILRSSPIFHKSSTKHPPLACMFIKYQIIKKKKLLFRTITQNLTNQNNEKTDMPKNVLQLYIIYIIAMMKSCSVEEKNNNFFLLDPLGLAMVLVRWLVPLSC